MKFLNAFVLIIFSFLLLSCESNEDSVLSADNFSKVSPISSNIQVEHSQILNDLDNVFSVQKIIDGTLGGKITFDTLFTDTEGNYITISADITFNPNSFSGTKKIYMSPDPTNCSIRFSPAISFNIPAELNLKFSGINLSRLGFNSNDKSDFVYLIADGGIELILKNECKIKWNSKEIYVKKAKLPHFSRYIFVR